MPCFMARLRLVWNPMLKAHMEWAQLEAKKVNGEKN